MTGASIARRTRSGTLVGPGICRKWRPERVTRPPASESNTVGDHRARTEMTEEAGSQTGERENGDERDELWVRSISAMYALLTARAAGRPDRMRSDEGKSANNPRADLPSSLLLRSGRLRRPAARRGGCARHMPGPCLL